MTKFLAGLALGALAGLWGAGWLLNWQARYDLEQKQSTHGA